jgi:hypothetical protein
MKISDLQRLEKPFECELEPGLVITGKFRPGVLTTGMLERLAGLSDKDGDREFPPTVLTETLGKLICSWDVTDDSGETIPVTVDAIRELIPTVYQRSLYDRIAEAARPGKAIGGNSAAG